MKLALAATMVITAHATLATKQGYMPYTAEAALAENKWPPAVLDTCEGISCPAIECQEPFVVKTPEETGMCCDMCDAKSVDALEDRSWVADLTGGVGANNAADPTLCRGVMCPKPQCAEYDEVFDGRAARSARPPPSSRRRISRQSTRP